MRRLVALALVLSLVDPITLFAQKPKKQKGKSQNSQQPFRFLAKPGGQLPRPCSLTK